jgi:hypothetical protein
MLTSFVEDARVTLAPVLGRAGGILYSAAKTLRPGQLYIMGLNPGGNPENSQPHNIGKSLDQLPQRTCNAYIDEAWDSRARQLEKGQAPLQRRIAFLAQSFGCALEDVCATNLIFMQTRSARDLDFNRDAERCWPVHEMMLAMVRPKLILAFGNSAISPYGYLRKMHSSASETKIPAGHGSWECKSFTTQIAGAQASVVGFPHLSRYSPMNKPALMEWLNAKVA